MIFVIILVLLLLASISSTFYERSRYSSSSEKDEEKTYTPNSVPHFRTYEEILSKNSKYYNQLNKTDKMIFMSRIHKFIRSKEFIPLQIDKVTPEMKILIASTAIQLTFGMDDYLLSNIQTIKIYPDIYHSKFLNADLKGHFNPKGQLYLSYKHFHLGIEYSEDGYNLGLHEVAHALHFCLSQTVDYSQYFEFIYRKWVSYTIKKNELRSDDNKEGFLRNYASKNQHEFFAVCVENFFERPAEFNKRLPLVYNHLSKILNQNPLNVKYESSDICNKDNLEFRENLSIWMPCVFLFLEIVVCFMILQSTESLGTFLFWIILVLVGNLIFFSSVKRMEFYSNSIIIRKFLTRSIYLHIPLSKLLIISIKPVNEINKYMVTFIFFDRKMNRKIDRVWANKWFLKDLKSYCIRHEVFYVEKNQQGKIEKVEI